MSQLVCFCWYRGNYNLAMTCIWLYCLTPWHTCWDSGDLKLRAHSGNHSMFPKRALLLTKQSSAKMSQDHHSEKIPALIFYLLLRVPYLLKYHFQCILRRRIFSLSLPLFHLWVIEKVAKQEEQFHNIAV